MAGMQVLAELAEAEAAEDDLLLPGSRPGAGVRLRRRLGQARNRPRSAGCRECCECLPVTHCSCCTHGRTSPPGSFVHRAPTASKRPDASVAAAAPPPPSSAGRPGSAAQRCPPPALALPEGRPLPKPLAAGDPPRPAASVSPPRSPPSSPSPLCLLHLWRWTASGSRAQRPTPHRSQPCSWLARPGAGRCAAGGRAAAAAARRPGAQQRAQQYPVRGSGLGRAVGAAAAGGPGGGPWHAPTAGSGNQGGPGRRGSTAAGCQPGPGGSRWLCCSGASVGGPSGYSNRRPGRRRCSGRGGARCSGAAPAG